MKIELSKSALTTDSTTVPVAINDPDNGIVEYRFRFPTKIEEIGIDVSDATVFTDLHQGIYSIEAYYRNSNIAEEASGSVGNHGKPVIFEETIVEGADTDIVSDGADSTLYASTTRMNRQLSESGWKATFKLKNPLWCLSFGIRIKLGN